MSETLLVPLVCGECGSELEGGASAVVFLCRACRQALCMEGGPRTYRASCLQSREGQGTAEILAPFWRVRGRAVARTEDADKRRIYTGAKPLGALLFPAFWSPRSAYYDDLTIRYALAPEPAEGAGLAGELLDGARGPGALPELSRLTWLGYLDRMADVTGVELTFQVQALDYVCVPFRREGDGLVEGVLGLKLPAAFLGG